MSDVRHASRMSAHGRRHGKVAGSVVAGILHQDSGQETHSAHKASRIASRVFPDSGLVAGISARFGHYGDEVTQILLFKPTDFSQRAGVFPDFSRKNCSNVPQVGTGARNLDDRVAKRGATRFISTPQAETIRGQHREFVFARHVKQ